MAKITTRYALGPYWTQVASGGQSVYLQCLDGDQVFYAFNPSKPPDDAFGHVLSTRSDYGTNAAVGHLWVRSSGSNAALSVTTNGLGGLALGTTTTYVLGATPVQVAAPGAVHMSCITGKPALFSYAASLAAITGYHKLWAGADEYFDEASDELIWARSESDHGLELSTIVVTVG